jgi:hypothetical protein
MSGHLRRGSIAAAVVAVAAIALPASASAGEPAVSLKVAKHKDGPYKPEVRTNIKLNQAKDFYWKARNVTDAEFPDVLLTDDGPYPTGWIVRWFRGDDNITSDVRGDGYEFVLQPGKSKLFRSRLKPTKTADEVCHAAGAGPSEPATDFALVVVNDAFCLF